MEPRYEHRKPVALRRLEHAPVRRFVGGIEDAERQAVLRASEVREQVCSKFASITLNLGASQSFSWKLGVLLKQLRTIVRPVFIAVTSCARRLSAASANLTPVLGTSIMRNYY